jgi:hypothetical protein
MCGLSNGVQHADGGVLGEFWVSSPVGHLVRARVGHRIRRTAPVADEFGRRGVRESEPVVARHENRNLGSSTDSRPSHHQTTS